VLARAAEEWDAQLVVVGSRGQGLVRRVMLGSVSDRLVHICTRPVLVFHDEKREETAG
jgi:nucleotide-binding universal stress UspA family protein